MHIKILLLKLVIKVADVGNGSYKFPVAQVWGRKATKEFRLQGIAMAAAHMEVKGIFSELQTIEDGQIGWLEWVMQPFFEVAVSVLGEAFDGVYEQLGINIAKLKAEKVARKRAVATASKGKKAELVGKND